MKRTPEERKAISREAKCQNRIKRLRDENPDLQISEICQMCSCDRRHHNIKERRCDVCWDYCTYSPAFVIKVKEEGVTT